MIKRKLKPQNERINTMQVQEIMTKDLEMASPSDSLFEVAKKMKSLDVGCMPVQDRNRIVGIVTDRDIVVRGMAIEKNPSDMSVNQIMSTNIASCFSDDSLEDAAHIMEEKKIRRLMVMDHNNTPVGVVSLGDIAAKSHQADLSNEILENVSQPAHPKL